MPKRTSMLLVSVAATLLGCDRKTDTRSQRETQTRAPVVYTTFYPTTYFTQRIGGKAIRVVCPCPPDADPAAWMPDSKTIAEYQRADLIVINGAGFEKWIDKVTLPADRIVDTAKPLADALITLKENVSHSHGPEGEHSHGGIDGHTWLDPVNAKQQADQIKAALIRRWPKHKEAFQANHAKLAKDLDALDDRFQAVSKKHAGLRFMASHPAYNYVARRYGWRQDYFFLEPHAAPDRETMQRLEQSVRREPADFLLWESQPSPDVAEPIERRLDVVNVLFSPCEALSETARSQGADYLAIMHANLDRLEAARK